MNWYFYTIASCLNHSICCQLVIPNRFTRKSPLYDGSTGKVAMETKEEDMAGPESCRIELDKRGRSYFSLDMTIQIDFF